MHTYLYHTFFERYYNDQSTPKIYWLGLTIHMSKGQKMLCVDIVFGCRHFHKCMISIDFLWGAIRTLEERCPLKSCKYVVMETCLHFQKRQKFGNDACSDAVRYLEPYPQIADVGSCFQTSKNMEENTQNSFAKTRAGACAGKCVLQAKMAGPTDISISFQLLSHHGRTLSEQFPS